MNAPRRAPPLPDRRREQLLLAVGAGALTATAYLASHVRADDSGRLDRRARDWMRTRAHPVLDGALHVAGQLGALPVYAPVIGAAAWTMRRRGRPWVPLIATVAAAAAAHVLLRQAVARTRPPRHRPKRAPAFPSGHATRATTTLALSAYVMTRESLLSPRLSVSLAAAGAAAAGASRAWHDHHWSTDVVGGWTLGIGAAALGAAAWERLVDERAT